MVFITLEWDWLFDNSRTVLLNFCSDIFWFVLTITLIFVIMI